MNEKRMALTEHLQDLKKMIIWCLIAMGVGFAIGYWQVDWLLKYLILPLPIDQLTSYTPTEAFMAELKIAFFAGLVLALPVLFASLAWFIAPGLTEKEKFWMPLIVLFSLVLFVIGFLVSYNAALPVVMKFFFAVAPGEMLPFISIAKYMTFVLNFIFMFGLMLQFPFLLLILIVTGFIPAEKIAKQRKYIVIIIITLGLSLGAGVDLLTQVILFCPVYLLFELSLFVGTKWRKRIDAKKSIGGEV